ncbi:MAG: PD-(D/E)XK nuclease family protein [Candidatus Helarchaeota archaeon]
MKIKYACRLNISDITNIDCPRKNYIEMLINIKGIKKNEPLNKWTLTGIITHSILENTLLNDFDLIEYFYFKKKFSLTDSIKEAMNTNKNYWFSFINEENEQYPWNRYLDFRNYVLEHVEDAITILAKLAQSLIIEKEHSLINKLIGREFQINYQINPFLIVIGRIDLLAWEKPNKLRIIEFKSGTKRRSDSSQIYTYYQIISKNLPEIEFTPEIWYIKNNKRALPKILKIPPDRDYLKLIQNTFKKVLRIKNEKDLPQMHNNTYYCNNICGLCNDYLDSIFQNRNITLLDYIE